MSLTIFRILPFKRKCLRLLIADLPTHAKRKCPMKRDLGEVKIESRISRHKGNRYTLSSEKRDPSIPKVKELQKGWRGSVAPSFRAFSSSPVNGRSKKLRRPFLSLDEMKGCPSRTTASKRPSLLKRGENLGFRNQLLGLKEIEEKAWERSFTRKVFKGNSDATPKAYPCFTDGNSRQGSGSVISQGYSIRDWGR